MDILLIILVAAFLGMKAVENRLTTADKAAPEEFPRPDDFVLEPAEETSVLSPSQSGQEESLTDDMPGDLPDAGKKPVLQVAAETHGPEKKQEKEKLDPKKMVIYSEIFRAKYLE